MGSQKPLNKLAFTDMYINLSNPAMPPRYRPDPTRSRDTGSLTVPDEYLQSSAEVANGIRDCESDEGTIQFQGLRLRFNRFEAAEGEIWAAVRAVPLDLPDLEGLRFDPELLKLIRSWADRKGLIVVGGRTGHGKTTTCVAAIREYLEMRGGFAFTVEDPIEYQMQGAISENSHCIQVEVDDDEDWAPAVKRAMRTRPDYILIGEIRTPGGAEQLLKAATSGHLVLTTTHGGSIADTLSSILQLAETRMNRKTAEAILADTLVAGIHQRLERGGPYVDLVMPERHDPNCPITRSIAKGELINLHRQKVSFTPERAR